MHFDCTSASIIFSKKKNIKKTYLLVFLAYQGKIIQKRIFKSLEET